MGDVTIIGIGEIGKDIALNLAEYEVYDIINIVSSEDASGTPDELPVPIKKNTKLKPAHEAYDDWAVATKDWLPDIQTEETVMFVSGKSNISGLSLATLGQIKGTKTVVYIQPDDKFLSSTERMQEKVTFYILQEYARSAAIENLILIDCLSLEAILGNLSIKKYNSEINKTIANYYHTWKWCEKNKPILGESSALTEHARIGTLGIKAQDQDPVLFFPLTLQDDEVPYPADIRYYFMYKTERIENDSLLLTKIKESVTLEAGKQMATIGYGIYETDGAEMTLIFTRTCKIQTRGETK